MKTIALLLIVLLLPTTAIAAHDLNNVANSKNKIEIAKKKTSNKKSTKKKKAKKPAKKKQAIKTYNYQGSGTISNIGEDEITLGVEFTSRNKALGNILKTETSANITVTDSTNFTVDGDPNSDFFDICQGDFVNISIITKKKLTAETFNTIPATNVVITTNDEDCSPISLD